MRKWLVVVGVVVFTVLLALAASQRPTSTAPSPSAVAGCHIRGPLPDPSCTPGVANPRVTQATIAQTICVVGWTGTIRPPTSYTTELKVQQMRAYGLTGTTADYEEDHLIALEVGGDPRDPRNLFPMAYEPRPGAHEKERLENYLHAQVCAGRMLLVDAQRSIATDWYATWVAAGTP